MKKFLVISTLLILSSCSLTGNTIPSNFEEYYSRNVHATIQSTEKLLESFGFFDSLETSGVFDALVSVPAILSGSLKSDYKIQSDGRNASLMATNGKLQYTSLVGSGFLSFDNLGMISESGDFHVLYKNLQDAGFSTPELREVFKKFDGTWLSWTQKDARASIVDPIEIQAMNIIENLSKINKKQIEKYLLNYPIWKSTADLGMSGALNVYQVEIDRTKILELVDLIKDDFTGSGFTREEQSILREQLALIDLSGTISFHPENTDTIEAFISLTDGSGAILGSISILTNQNTSKFNITSTQDSGSIDYTYTHGDNRNDMTLTLSQSGREIGKMVGYTLYKNGLPYDFSLEMIAQGVTAAFRHTEQENGKFEGRMLFPVGSVSWNGIVTDKKLTELKILGVSPMGAMDLDLTSSGEMIRGPFTLRVGEEEVMRAMIGMVAESERLRLSVDIPQEVGSADMIHAEFGITMTQSEFSDKIKTPSGTRSILELFSELEKIAPQQFTEDGGSFNLDDTKLDI